MALMRGMDFDRLGHIAVQVAGDADPAIARYFYRLKEDDFVSEFCVAGAVGPNSVETETSFGVFQNWESYHEGDLLVFKAPDGYSGGQALLWAYDGRLQRGEAMPRRELERRALNMRTSLIVNGMKGK